MRIILISGKGGTGKTSYASITGYKCAEKGLKTLIISTDPAHSLGDSLDIELTGEPKKVMDNLYALEVDINNEFRIWWNSAGEYIKKFLMSRGLEKAFVDEFSVPPGFDEILGLLKIRDFLKSDYDIIIVDMAPTGNTYRLLSLPDLLEAYGLRLIEIERKVVGVARRFQFATSIPMPPDDVYVEILNLYEEMKKLRVLLSDPKQTTIRVITTPEVMSIKETLRIATFLDLYNIALEAIVVNRIIPDVISEPFFREWKESHRKNIEEIEKIFKDTEIFKMPLFSFEIRGLDQIKKASDMVYDNKDPKWLIKPRSPHKIIRDEKTNQTIIQIKFPEGFEKKDFTLFQEEDELLIHVGKMIRRISLRDLKGDVVKSKFRDNRLEIFMQNDSNYSK